MYSGYVRFKKPKKYEHVVFIGQNLSKSFGQNLFKLGHLKCHPNKTNYNGYVIVFNDDSLTILSAEIRFPRMRYWELGPQSPLISVQQSLKLAA